eukprot:15411461-Heterocapsa_arctica.AAC.1
MSAIASRLHPLDHQATYLLFLLDLADDPVQDEDHLHAMSACVVDAVEGVELDVRHVVVLPRTPRCA